MASELKTRITGKVVHTEKQKFGAGERAFQFLEVHIQTGPASIVPVRFTDRWTDNGYDVPRVKDFLDLEVTVGGYTGRSGLDLSATATRYFDESYLLELQTAAA